MGKVKAEGHAESESSEFCLLAFAKEIHSFSGWLPLPAASVPPKTQIPVWPVSSGCAVVYQVWRTRV